MKGRVLIIAGSDPSGGAGIQADIKTVTALGGYAMTAITALTVQDTQGVYDIVPVAPDIISKQIKTVIRDIGVDAIKIGMIGSVIAGEAILSGLFDAGIVYDQGLFQTQKRDGEMIPLVLDPVLAATSGDRLTDGDDSNAKDGTELGPNSVEELILHKLLPLSYLITPNIPEAEILCDLKIKAEDDQRVAGRKLVEGGANIALVKGGHGHGETIIDMMIAHDTVMRFENPRLHSSATHGTGCTLSTAIATGLALNLPVETVIECAISFVRKGIETAPGFGAGHGPLNHGHSIQSFWSI